MVMIYKKEKQKLAFAYVSYSSHAFSSSGFTSQPENSLPERHAKRKEGGIELFLVFHSATAPAKKSKTPHFLNM